MLAAAGTVVVDDFLCGQCGACVPICPVQAIVLTPVNLRIDRNSCTSCGDCIRFCPVEALEFADE